MAIPSLGPKDEVILFEWINQRVQKIVQQLAPASSAPRQSPYLPPGPHRDVPMN